MFVFDKAQIIAGSATNFIVLAGSLEHEFEHRFELLVVGRKTKPKLGRGGMNSSSSDPFASPAKKKQSFSNSIPDTDGSSIMRVT